MRGWAALLPVALLAAASSTAPARKPSPRPPAATISPPPMIAGNPPRIAATPAPEFRKCAACHNAEKNGPSGLGPNLYGVFGRPAATSQPAYRYSRQLRQSGLKWNEATLDRWLAGPGALVPGTKMTFSGLRNPEERKAVIAFLRRRSEPRP